MSKNNKDNVGLLLRQVQNFDVSFLHRLPLERILDIDTSTFSYILDEIPFGTIKGLDTLLSKWYKKMNSNYFGIISTVKNVVKSKKNNKPLVSLSSNWLPKMSLSVLESLIQKIPEIK